MYKFLVGLALMTIAFWSCKDEINKTGYDLLLPGDLVSAHKVVIDKNTIQSFTVIDDSVRTNKPEYNLLGTFNDPDFGKTTADFAAQFHLDTVPDFTNIIFDKLELKLLYIESYGDEVTPQSIKVYELNKDLSGDDRTTYYQNIDLKGMANSEVLGEVMYTAKKLEVIYDSTKVPLTPGSSIETPKDTVIHEIVIPLSTSLANKLMAIDVSRDPNNTLPHNPNDKLLAQFKGLYVEADNNLNQGGAIMRVRTMASDSHLRLYFHKPNDSIQYHVEYRMTSTAARTNRFDHDYSNTAFFANLDLMNQQDENIYLQTTGGLSNKIFIPSLSNWKDSIGVAINKAELILKADEAFIDTLLYPAPTKLILSLIGDDDKVLKKDETTGQLVYIVPSDFGFSEAYYGGVYNEEDGTYRFNLAKHMQEIIKGEVNNNGFYLSTNNKNAIYDRVVLKGAASETGIRFEVTYSKIK